MSQAAYAYIPTAPAKITKALSDIFISMESAEQRFNRSANTNVIVAVSSVEMLNDIERTIDVLCLVHPSRFFVVYIDDSLEEIATSISARCHGLSRSEHACSEVIRIGTPRKKLGVVPSIIRGHFMVGTPAELYLADGAVSRELVDGLTPLVDLVIYDSEDFSQRLEIISETARLCSNLLDLDWIELGPWRDEIKGAFGKAMIRERLPDLSEIVIRSSGGVGALPPFCSLLLAGWMVDRLGLTHLMGRQGALTAHYPGGRTGAVSIRFDSTPGSVARVDGVDLRFGGDEKGEIRFVRAKGLETFVELGRSMHWSRPLELEDREGLIRRYFLIGESTANYTAALRGALHLRHME